MLSVLIPANGEQNETNVLAPCSAVPNFCDVMLQEARRAGLDPALVDAVMKVESDYRADAIGAAGEIGLMQVRPSTARLLGFMGSVQELAEPSDQHSARSDISGEGLETCPRRLVSCPHEVSCWPRRGPNDALVGRILPSRS